MFTGNLFVFSKVLVKHHQESSEDREECTETEDNNVTDCLAQWTVDARERRRVVVSEKGAHYNSRGAAHLRRLNGRDGWLETCPVRAETHWTTGSTTGQIVLRQLQLLSLARNHLRNSSKETGQSIILGEWWEDVVLLDRLKDASGDFHGIHRFLELDG